MQVSGHALSATAWWPWRSACLADGELSVNELADLLAKHGGGLKGVVQAERRARKVEKGEHVKPVAVDPRPRLRSARARDLAEFAYGSEEFVVLVARRDADGQVAIVGSVDDAGLTDKVLAKTVV